MTLQEMDKKAEEAEEETRLTCSLFYPGERPVVSTLCVKLFNLSCIYAFESVFIRVEECEE